MSGGCGGISVPNGKPRYPQRPGVAAPPPRPLWAASLWADFPNPYATTRWLGAATTRWLGYKAPWRHCSRWARSGPPRTPRPLGLGIPFTRRAMLWYETEMSHCNGSCRMRNMEKKEMSHCNGSCYDENLPASDQLSLQRRDIPLRPAGRRGGQVVRFRYHVVQQNYIMMDTQQLERTTIRISLYTWIDIINK